MKQQQNDSINSSQKESKQQKDSISIYKFKFKDTLTRNMLSRSNMDHRLADETAEGLNK